MYVSHIYMLRNAAILLCAAHGTVSSFVAYMLADSGTHFTLWWLKFTCCMDMHVCILHMNIDDDDDNQIKTGEIRG